MLNDMPMGEPVNDDPATAIHAPSEVLAAIQRGIARAREQFAESLSGALDRISAELRLGGASVTVSAWDRGQLN